MKAQILIILLLLSFSVSAQDVTRKIRNEQIQYTYTDVVVAANSTATASVEILDIIQVFETAANTGAMLTRTGTVDPTNVSTGEANLINGNTTTDLCYNNSSAGSNSKELPGVSLAAPTALGSAYIYWYSATYTPVSFKMQGSNDGVNFTDITSPIAGIWTANGVPQIVSVTGTWQHVRLFSITGNNATWTVMRELELLGIGTGNTTSLWDSDNISVSGNGTSIDITNNTAAPITVTIKH